MQAQRIRSVRPIGRKQALDFTVGHKDHNFYAEGVVVSNCHSIAYAIICARSIYLKIYYPTEFWWATLEMNRNESKKYDGIGVIEREMRNTGFTLLPPDLVKSEVDFKIEEPKKIRFALAMIRGLAHRAARLDDFRLKQGLNKFETFEAIKNAGLNIGVCSAIIQAGCLPGLDRYLKEDGTPYHSRSRLVLEAQTWNLLKKEREPMLQVGHLPEVNWDVFKGIKYLNEVAKTEKGKPVLLDKRRETIRKHHQDYLEIYQLNSRNERLANFFYERKVLGYSYTENLRGIFGQYTEGLVSIAEACQLPKETWCRLIGFVGKKPAKAKTKKGNDEFRFTLSDETGECRIKAFNDRIDLIVEQNGRLPVHEDIVVCNVKHMGDGTFFCQANSLDGSVIGIQTAKIYMRLSELEKKRGEKNGFEDEDEEEQLTPDQKAGLEIV